MIKEEPKQETLEEVGLNHCDMLDKFPALVNPLFSFKEGAKWQKERMYSEEEVLDILDKFITSMVKGEKSGLIEEWFEQHKKK